MRAVTLPFSEVNEKGGAVRDAVCVYGAVLTVSWIPDSLRRFIGWY